MLVLLSSMLALGIDPGTLRLGWGLVEREGTRIQHVGHGVVRLDPAQPLAVRLSSIDRDLSSLIAQHRPDVGSVETLFFHKDAQAAAKLGHARGVVLACFARSGVPVAEYAPAHVKRTVAGRGDATKEAVARMVSAILGFSAPPASDAADALAIALTHLRAAPLTARLRPQLPTGRKICGRRKLAALVRAQQGG